MLRQSRPSETARLFFWRAFLLFTVDAVLALRLPSSALIKPRSGNKDVTDDVFREVLSPQSTLLTGLAPGLGAHAGDPATSFSAVQILGNVELSSAAQLRDPGLATVFSAHAHKQLPRLARGPSVPPTPQLSSRLGQGNTTSAVADAEPGSDREQVPEQEQENPERRQQQFLRQHQQRQAEQHPQHPHPQQQQQAQQQEHPQQQEPQREQGAAVGAADPPPPDFDVDEALIAGRLASIAYCSHPDLLQAWNCSRCAAVPGFVPHRVVYDPVWDLAAYAGYYAPWNAVVLAFRGTDSSNWGQWAENMRAWRTDHMYPVPDFPHALIHAGFFTLWTGSSLQATFSAAVAELTAAHPGVQLVAVGHSMGGALAQLAGLELKLAYSAMRTRVYTFGAPRVGNLAYQQLFNSFIDVSWRLTHNRDMVPSVPLQLMGFQHVAREVWEVDVEDPRGAGSGVDRKLLLCDATGEDPSCHNSACYLGLCTSIADHLLYLGLHMYQDGDEC